MSSSIPDKQFPGQVGYPTPNAAPTENGCRIFSIPADEEWFALFMSAVQTLTYEWNWYQNGSMTQAEAAAACGAIIDAAYEQAEVGGCLTDVEAPYWDAAANVGDSATPEAQTWYGQVIDPFVDPDELTFVENVIVWGFTGLLAVATAEVAFAPAILFNTVAPKFIVAMKKADIGEILRIVVDGKDAAKIDTTDYDADALIQIPILTDPAISPPHSLMIIGTPA